MTWVKPSRCDTATCCRVERGPTDVVIYSDRRPEFKAVLDVDEFERFVEDVKAGMYDPIASNWLPARGDVGSSAE